MKNTFKLNQNYYAIFLTQDEFEKINNATHKIDQDIVGQYYRFKVIKEKAKTTVYISNQKMSSIDQIDRDDSWNRRKELTRFLEAYLDEKKTNIQFKKMMLSILNRSYQESIDRVDDEIYLLELFYKNSQESFNKTIEEYAKDIKKYDVNRYGMKGVIDEQYSHIQHFGWIYWQQIQLVLDALDKKEGKLKILDLGAGACSFILTAAHFLKKKNLLHKVTFVAVDRSERDMKFGKKMLSKFGNVEVEFVTDNVTSTGFANRLIRHEPDIIISNHLLEHLSGDIKNLFLHDWLIAAKDILSISLPLKDKLEESLSDHVQYFDVNTIKSLAQSMELRSGYAVRVKHIDYIKNGGLINFQKIIELKKSDGLSSNILNLTPEFVEEIQEHPIYDDFKTVYQLSKFKHKKRALKIAQLKDQRTFAREGDHPRQLRQMPIKMPHTEVKLPVNFAQFEEAIQLIINHNKAINPDYDDNYMYLNVFRGMTKFNSYRGLSLSCHGDQMQGLNQDFWYKPDYSYIVSSTLPTSLFEQGFDLSDGLERYRNGEKINLYNYFSTQAKDNNKYFSENFGIYLLSPYIIHSASFAEKETFRVFMKVAISSKRFFDNRELRRNPAFEYKDWYQQETVGYTDGWLQHAHFNERFIKEDIIRQQVNPKISISV